MRRWLDITLLRHDRKLGSSNELPGGALIVTLGKISLMFSFSMWRE